MTNRTVSRPTTRLVTNENGTHTFITGFDSSLVEYVYRANSSDIKHVKQMMGNFTKYFNQQADGIEKDTIKPYAILPTLAQHGKFTTRHRIDTNKIGF